MSTANFVPDIWAAETLEAFRTTNVFMNLVNQNYQGEVTGKGSTVKITTPGAIAIGNYTGTVTYEDPDSTQQSLLIDQDKYWAFKMDSLVQVQAVTSLRTAYTIEAGEALAQDVDKNIAGLYTAAGAGNIDATLTGSTPDDMYKVAVEAGLKLDLGNVSRSGRWMVVSPVGYAALLENTKFTQASALGDSVVQSGAVGRVAGFTVYTSNNLTLATTRRYLFGTNAAITFAGQLTENETMRAETAFNDLWRGRYVFGRKVVRPAALGTISATE